MQQVASQWAYSDPQAAANRVTTFPAGSTRDSAIHSVIAAWGNSDPAGAGQWLASLPDDKEKQSAIQSYVNHISWQYPQMAAPWAEALADERQRNQAIENVARQWLQTDSTSAKAWIMKTSMPAEVKQRLLKTQ